MRRSLDWLLIGSWAIIITFDLLLLVGLWLGVEWLVDRLAS